MLPLNKPALILLIWLELAHYIGRETCKLTFAPEPLATDGFWEGWSLFSVMHPFVEPVRLQRITPNPWSLEKALVKNQRLTDVKKEFCKEEEPLSEVGNS